MATISAKGFYVVPPYPRDRSVSFTEIRFRHRGGRRLTRTYSLSITSKGHLAPYVDKGEGYIRLSRRFGYALLAAAIRDGFVTPTRHS